jgi:tRNA threonylcarbamoyl adenosine modification protein (Sua5/YciO/YrdC/YwlC family)
MSKGKTLLVDQRMPNAAVLGEAAQVLRGCGVLVMPTDSVYGIGCAATESNPGHERIFQIKHRDRAQTLPWLVGDPADLQKYGRNVPGWAERLAASLWPGALTLVVEASDLVPHEYCAADGTIALRVPDSNLVRALAREVGPLATTSANTHGEAAATSGASVEQRIVAEADLTLDAGPAPLAVASTIVGVRPDGPHIYRVGAIDTSVVERVCGESAKG